MSRNYDPLYSGQLPMINKLFRIPPMMNTQVHHLSLRKSVSYSVYVRQAIQEKIERDAATYPEVLHLEVVPPKAGK